MQLKMCQRIRKVYFAICSLVIILSIIFPISIVVIGKNIVFKSSFPIQKLYLYFLIASILSIFSIRIIPDFLVKKIFILPGAKKLSSYYWVGSIYMLGAFPSMCIPIFTFFIMFVDKEKILFPFLHLFSLNITFFLSLTFVGLRRANSLIFNYILKVALKEKERSEGEVIINKAQQEENLLKKSLLIFIVNTFASFYIGGAMTVMYLHQKRKLYERNTVLMVLICLFFLSPFVKSAYTLGGGGINGFVLLLINTLIGVCYVLYIWKIFQMQKEKVKESKTHKEIL